jgi:dihydroorotase
MTGLETCYALANMPGALSQDQLIRALSINPRRITGMNIPVIKEGEKAELTAFDPKASWMYTKTKSLSKNTPLLGKNVNGGVIATFC